MDDYDAMMTAQGSRCAVCKRSFGDRRPHVDHDHDCQHPDKGTSCCRQCVRGLLCSKCNHFVGWVENNSHLLAPVLLYLGVEIEDP